MHVGEAVEQHDDGNVRETATALVEPKIHRDCHCAHRSNLQVEHRDVGSSLRHGSRDITPIAAHRERCLWCAEGGDDVVEHVLSVGCHEDVHDARLSLHVATVVVRCSVQSCSVSLPC